MTFVLLFPVAARAQRAPAYARPVEYRATSLAGDSIHIGDHEPLTLVNVFATWCTTCKTEFADLEMLAREYAAGRVRVIAVSVDEGPSAKVRRFVAARKITFAVVHDSTGRVARAFGTVGVPESYLVDADGRIIWHRGGELGPALASLRRVVAAPP